MKNSVSVKDEENEMTMPNALDILQKYIDALVLKEYKSDVNCKPKFILSYGSENKTYITCMHNGWNFTTKLNTSDSIISQIHDLYGRISNIIWECDTGPKSASETWENRI